MRGTVPINGASATDPQARHSPHRPTHFADAHPHSEHW
jgi:hypothetical protein